MTQLNNRFTLEEFEHSDTAIRDKIDNTIPAIYLPKAKIMADYLVKVETVLGIKISLNSVWRCDKLNIVIGGAHTFVNGVRVETSQHTKMEAGDTEADKYGVDEYYMKVKEAVENKLLEVDQCISEFSISSLGHVSRWVHLSYVEDRKNRNQFLYGKRTNKGTVYSDKPF